MKTLKKFGVFAITLTAVLGYKFYDKSATAKEVKQEMLNVCSTDNNCQKAVSTYFQKCFDSSYSMGSRRRASSLDTQKLSTCINNSSGVAYFGS